MTTRTPGSPGSQGLRRLGPLDPDVRGAAGPRLGCRPAAFVDDAIDRDLDRGVREMGATDIGVGRHVKTMARGFFGRVAAYEKGLRDKAALRSAMRRNLYGTADPGADQLEMAVSYLLRQVEALAGASTASLLVGKIPFAPMGDVHDSA